MRSNCYRGTLLIFASLALQLSCRTNHRKPDLGQIPNKENKQSTGNPGDTAKDGGSGNGDKTTNGGKNNNNNGNSGSSRNGNSGNSGNNNSGNSAGEDGKSDVNFQPELGSEDTDGYMPTCKPDGLKTSSFELKYVAGSGSQGSMVISTGSGFSCKKTVAVGNDKFYPLCSVACPSQTSQLASDWGWCKGELSFTCKK